MKKILCGILAAAMAVSCAACSGGGDYSDYDTAVLEVESVSAKAGDTVDVQVYLGNNPGTSVVEVELEFDTSVLTPVSAKVSGDLRGQGLFSSNVTEDEYEMIPDGEYLHAMWFNAYDTDANGEIMTLTFEVAEDAPAGEYALSFVESEDNLVNENYENVEVTYLAGNVTIS